MWVSSHLEHSAIYWAQVSVSQAVWKVNSNGMS